MGENCPPYTSLGAQPVPCLLWGWLQSSSQAPLAGGHDLCVLTFLAWVLSFLGLFIQGFWPKSLQLPLPRLQFGVDEPWRQFPPFWLISQFFSTPNLIPLLSSDPRIQYSRAIKLPEPFVHGTLKNEMSPHPCWSTSHPGSVSFLGGKQPAIPSVLDSCLCHLCKWLKA